MGEQRGPGVTLPEGETGSSYLLRVLREAQGHFDELGGQGDLPSDPESFKAAYGRALAGYELRRAASERRAEVARYIVRRTQQGLRYVADGQERGLCEALAQPAEPLPLERAELSGSGRLLPALRFRGKHYAGAQIEQLVSEWQARHYMTEEAAVALRRVLTDLLPDGLSLRDQRFALLGAAAELAPTRLLLEAGADVLWVDVREPPAELILDAQLGGRLSFVRGGADLLTQPREIAATLRQFAGDEGAHVWMYAYAGGAAQEWRLTASMNAIVRSLPRGAVRSVALLISPTTPGVVSGPDAALARARGERAAAWKRGLARVGRFQPGQLGSNGLRVSQSVVSTQGISYQAAQYVGKILAAETYAVYGNRLDDDGSAPLLTSANVAPITATRSLAHPVFEAAFLGAPLFDILISEAHTTRTLNGLLTLHDILYPPSDPTQHPSQRAKALFSKQIHGGVYAQPYALDGCIAVAALRGLGKRPRLLAGLLR